jgi:hypothetical protein
MKLAKRNVFRPISGFFYDDIHRPRMALAYGADIACMRLLSSPNSGNELLESLILGRLNCAPTEVIFGFLPSVIRGIVKPRKLELFDDLSSREFRACGSLS